MSNDPRHDIDLTVLSPALLDHYHARARVERAQAIADLLIAGGRFCAGLLRRLPSVRPGGTGRLSMSEVAPRAGLAGR